MAYNYIKPMLLSAYQIGLLLQSVFVKKHGNLSGGTCTFYGGADDIVNQSGSMASCLLSSSFKQNGRIWLSLDSHFKKVFGAVEMAWWLRALVFSEELGSVPT